MHNTVESLPLAKNALHSPSSIVVYRRMTQHNYGRVLNAESAHHTLRYKIHEPLHNNFRRFVTHCLYREGRDAITYVREGTKQDAGVFHCHPASVRQLRSCDSHCIWLWVAAGKLVGLPHPHGQRRTRPSLARGYAGVARAQHIFTWALAWL